MADDLLLDDEWLYGGESEVSLLYVFDINPFPSSVNTNVEVKKGSSSAPTITENGRFVRLFCCTC